MVKKIILFLAVCSGLQTWCMEQQPAQSEKKVPTLFSMCCKALLKDNSVLRSLSLDNKRKFIHQFFANYGTDVRACDLGAAQYVQYSGGYRFLTPGAVRDIVLNKECLLTERTPCVYGQNIVEMNGTVAEHHGGYISLHLWDENDPQPRTCVIPGQHLIDSYANCCFITSRENALAGSEDNVLWYRNQQTFERLGYVYHWYDCIECSKVFFLLDDGTMRVLDKKTCNLDTIQLRQGDLLPTNFIHYDKKIEIYKRDADRRQGVVTVLNSSTYAVEREYPCAFEHGYCNKIMPGAMVECKNFYDNAVAIYDLENKKVLASLKASCRYEYLVANKKSYVVIVPRSQGESVQLWDVSKRRCIKTFDAQWRYINVCHGTIIFEKDNQVFAWHVAKKDVALVVSEHGQQDTFDLSTYDKYLIVKDAQCLKIWDMEALICVHTMARGEFDIYTHSHILTVVHDDARFSALPLCLLEGLEREVYSLSDDQVEYVIATLFYLEQVLDQTESGDYIRVFSQEHYRKLPERIQHLIFQYFETQAMQNGCQLALIKENIYCLSKNK